MLYGDDENSLYDGDERTHSRLYCTLIIIGAGIVVVHDIPVFASL